jgi:hypothetical protein
MSGGNYTCSNRQVCPTLKNLDRFFYVPWLGELISLGSGEKICSDMSDHSPLLVISGDSNNTPPKHRVLKFDIARFKQEDFLETIAKILDKPIKSSDHIDILKIKLKTF